MRNPAVAGLLYAGAAGADLLTTNIALRLGLSEGNPVVAPFINSFGLAPQIVISAFLCYVLWWYARRGGAVLVLVLASIRWVVVANNALQLASANHLIGVLRLISMIGVWPAILSMMVR